MVQKPPSILTANLACFFAMLLWAVGFPATEVLLDSWGALSLLNIRMGISAVLLLLCWAYFDGFEAIVNANWPLALLVGGLGFGIGTILLMIGQKLSDPVTPAIAAAMMPIFGAMLEILFDGRKLRPLLVLGILLALGGGYLATGVKLEDSQFGLGALLCLLAIILFACATRANTKNFQDLSALGQSTVGIVGAFTTGILCYLIAISFGLGETGIGNHDVFHISLLLYVAIFSIAVAQSLWIWAVGGLGILVASFHMNAVPFYVMVTVVLLMGGEWNWWQAAGAGLVAVGVILAQLASRRQWTSDQAHPLATTDIHNND